jgi:diadenosine tetraphosphate (Ap4A) HIT family hydrolase
MEAVATVEQVLRQQLPPDLRPTKINLASLGNVVPHLHWHIIARYDWDSHYPDPVWATARRAPDAQQLQALQAQLPALDAALQAALAALAA